MNTVFHVAPTERHDRIFANGIAPATAHKLPQQFSISGESHVYFWDSLKAAEYWANYHGPLDAEIWECEVPTTYEEDPNNPSRPYGTNAYRTTEVLVPVAIW